MLGYSELSRESRDNDLLQPNSHIRNTSLIAAGQHHESAPLGSSSDSASEVARNSHHPSRGLDEDADQSLGLADPSRDFLLAQAGDQSRGLDEAVTRKSDQSLELADSREYFLLAQAGDQSQGLVDTIKDDFLSPEIKTEHFHSVEINQQAHHRNYLMNDYDTAALADPDYPMVTDDPSYDDLHDLESLYDLESDEDQPSWSRRNDKVLLLGRGHQRRTFSSESEAPEVGTSGQIVDVKWHISCLLD